MINIDTCLTLLTDRTLLTNALILAQLSINMYTGYVIVKVE